MLDQEHTVPVDDQVVSARLQRPEDAACLLVLGHGAGSNREHPIMTGLADAMLAQGIGVFRYNFPFSERGSRRIDPRPVILATARAAVTHTMELVADLPVFAGGHSFGGRMSSTLQSQRPIDGLSGIVFCSFPLHPPGKPSIERAAHLKRIEVPMLFLSGTRDRLATQELLTGVCAELPMARLHWLDTADHGYSPLKRKGSREDVMNEMAHVTREWTNGVLSA